MAHTQSCCLKKHQEEGGEERGGAEMQTDEPHYNKLIMFMLNTEEAHIHLSVKGRVRGLLMAAN